MEGSKTLLCSGAHTCSLPLYVLLLLCSSCSILLPLPQSPFPKTVLWLSHRYPKPPVICHSLLVITHIQPLLKEISDLESFSFPPVLLTKHHSSVFQPCRWLAPPLGEWQFTLQDDLPINVYTVSGFLFLFCKNFLYYFAKKSNQNVLLHGWFFVTSTMLLLHITGDSL